MADVRFSGFSECQDPKAQLLLSWHSPLYFWVGTQESFQELNKQVRGGKTKPSLRPS